MEKSSMITEIISGILISFVMIPESIAFAYILDLPASIGIQSAMVMSFFTSILGTPALISGATASVATSLLGVSYYAGKEYIPLTVVLGGVIQWLIGITGLYKYIKELPPSVNSGFLLALAVLIATSQINNLKDSNHHWFATDKMFYTLFMVIIALFIIQFGFIILRLKNMNIKIPGGLVEIAILSMAAFFLHIPVETIADKGKLTHSLPQPQNPLLPKMDMVSIMKIIPFALSMAVAGLIESIIMVERVNDIHKEKYCGFREVMVQGLANIISGCTGGIGGCVLVGESMMNLENGASSRISSITASINFILCNLFLSSYIEMISLPAIIAIMLHIVYLTGDWNSIAINSKNMKQKIGDKSWLTTVVTAGTGIVSNNLTFGVLSGYLFDRFMM